MESLHHIPELELAMDALLPILVVLAAATFAAQIGLTTVTLRRIITDHRSRVAREARQARRYAPVERQLVP